MAPTNFDLLCFISMNNKIKYVHIDTIFFKRKLPIKKLL